MENLYDPEIVDPSQLHYWPGIYAVELRLAGEQALAVGKRPPVHFPAGNYIYFGSALGAGGLGKRLGRHLWPFRFQRIHWHIDYLRQAAVPIAALFMYVRTRYAPGDPTPLPAWPELPVECLWSQEALRWPGASIPMRRFGASDCESGCRAHLVGFLDQDDSASPLLAEPQRWRSLRDACGNLGEIKVLFNLQAHQC